MIGISKGCNRFVYPFVFEHCPFGFVIQRNGVLKMTRKKESKAWSVGSSARNAKGAQMVLYRKRAEQRKLGHVKHMYCPSCKETKAFTEIKDWDRNVVFGKIIKMRY